MKKLVLAALLGCLLTGWTTAATAANFTVTKTADTADGTCNSDCSLREALTAANAAAGADVILFAPAVRGTIALTSPLPAITGSLTVTGPGAKLLAIGPSGVTTRVFRILAGNTVALTNLTLQDGNAGGSAGGGILNDHSALSLTNCVLQRCSANLGGAIYNGGDSSGSATLTLTNCTLQNNHATSGAGIYNSGAVAGTATLTLNKCTLASNTADSKGGALYNRGAAVLLNCTLAANSAGTSGGALHNESWNDGAVGATLTHCTLQQNAAPTGNCVYNRGNSGTADLTAVVLRNTILNATGPSANLVNQDHAAIGSTGFNLCSDGGGGFLTAATDQLNRDPLLDPAGLQDHGGMVPTIALMTGSPALDQGRNFGTTTDARGQVRPFDDPSIAPASGGDNSDIGAFEAGDALQPGPTFTVTTTNDHDDGVCGTTDCTLREAIAAANGHLGTDTISFAPPVTGTINLSGALPALSTDLTLQGPGAALLTVRRNTGGDYSIFTIGNGTATGPTVTVAGLTITNGNAPGGGGGVLNDRGSLTVQNCTLTGNLAVFGGGLANGGGSLTVVNSILSGNTAIHGGAISNANGTLSVAHCTLSANQADGLISGSHWGWGGAISNGGGSLSVINSTLYANYAATDGGAIMNQDATATIAACTLSNNNVGSTGRSASGISDLAGIGQEADVTLSNTILQTTSARPNLRAYSDQDGNNPGVVNIWSLGYNLTSDFGYLYGTGDQHSTDARLDPAGLQDNGGPTPTIALLAPSPALQGGDPAGLPGDAYDQRGTGFARVSGARIDIGAYEYQNHAPVVDQSANPTLTVAGQGTSIQDLVGAAISDPDPGALEGIAITGAVTTYGTFEYSLNGGQTWLPLGAVSPTSARLLAADAAGLHRLRYLPNSSTPVTRPNQLTFLAWDKTSVGDGGLANTVPAGGSAAYSVLSQTVAVQVPADSGPPLLTMTLPVRVWSVWNIMPPAYGTAQDSSGIRSLTYRLYRSDRYGGPAGYWNGNPYYYTGQIGGFDATYNPAVHELTASSSDGYAHWVARVAQRPGLYYIQVTATDGVGKTSTAVGSFINNWPYPQVTIAVPAANGSYALGTLTQASGAASDSNSAYTITAIKVRLYRYATNGNTAGYWNGVDWGPYGAAAELPATFTPGSAPSWTLNLPSLDVGQYYVLVTAWDSYGNWNQTTNNFKITP